MLITDTAKSLKETLRQVVNGSTTIHKQAGEVLTLISQAEEQFEQLCHLAGGNFESLAERLEEKEQVLSQAEEEVKKLKRELELTKTALADTLKEISEREDVNQIREVLRQLSRKIEDPDACLTDKHILSIQIS